MGIENVFDEKFYLGISFGFNSSACIVSSKRGLICAVSQERLNGEKNTKAIPYDAIEECFKMAHIGRIYGIAYSHYGELTLEYLNKNDKRMKHDVNEINISGMRKYTVDWLLKFVKSLGIQVVDDVVVRVDHHIAHALSGFGFYNTPTGNHVIVTSDGYGDFNSGTISYNGTNISNVRTKNSIGLVYQFVTGALGFKEHQHEGKITGLAAYGEPRYFDDFFNLFEMIEYGNGLNLKITELDVLSAVERKKVATSGSYDFDEFIILKKKVYGLVEGLVACGATREDIAASVQMFAEYFTTEWIKSACAPLLKLPMNEKPVCYLAGGLFANVKINQKIKDLNYFKEVLVCPAMGDEGTCVGAAIKLDFIQNGQHIYSDTPGSTEYSSSKRVISGCGVYEGTAQVKKYLHEIRNKVNTNEDCALHGEKSYFKVTEIKYESNVAEYVADLLAQSKIVCLVRGQMEFGPRALCHRSILYNCDTKETNDWLNKKLGRTEFMPFAPVCLWEDARDLFKNLEGGERSGRFMTMTFDCTDEFANNYPAACHIDKTARPQFIRNSDDFFMHELLLMYQEKTGKKALINTSFNLHNHPIIADYKTAIDSWLISDTDVLVINNCVIEKLKSEDEDLYDGNYSVRI